MNCWPWSKSGRSDRDEADQAVERANDDLEDARGRRPHVDRLTSSLYEKVEHNHFADAVARVWEGSR